MNPVFVDESGNVCTIFSTPTRRCIVEGRVVFVETLYQGEWVVDGEFVLWDSVEALQQFLKQ